MIYFASVSFIIYLIYTANFVVKFNKINISFTKGQKIIHNILVWLIPFFWILIIRSMTKPTPGSHNFEDKDEDKGFYESGLGG